MTQQDVIDPESLDALWQPVTVGSMQLAHRLAMAPMTRSRADADGSPNALNAAYYGQRASLSMVITEATQPSDDGQGYMDTPGVYTEAQARGWRAVADAVHARGSYLVVQLMHVGRIAHPDNTPHGRQALAPSAVAPDVQMFTPNGPQPAPTPAELDAEGIATVIDEFRHAARVAVDAGADAVELHGANGYLLHQFLSTNANRRTDGYGGSVENRIRLTVEVAKAVAGEIGADRTGLRISPANPLNDIVEDDTDEVYVALVRALAPLGLAYLHVVQGPGDDALLRELRALWPGVLVLNRAGAPLPKRAEDIADGLADVVTVGALALANPDLVQRVRSGAPLNEADKASFYGGDEHGYTDYPTLDADAQEA